MRLLKRADGIKKGIDMNKWKLFLKIYFWITIGLITIFAFEEIALSLKDIAQILFTYIGYLALFGYAYDKKILNQIFWKSFIIPFFNPFFEKGACLKERSFHNNFLPPTGVSLRFTPDW